VSAGTASGSPASGYAPSAWTAPETLIEPEAASRLGIGWYLTAAALLTLAVFAIGRMRHARSIS
jgi:hypothetical protein